MSNNRPEYYGGKDNQYEVVKVINAWGLGFELGNVLKYIKRAGKKSEDPIADLQKAATYIDMEIRRLKQELSEPHEDFSL
jgi:hypothetical protein